MWLTLLLLFIIYVVWKKIYEEENPLDRVPGPPGLPFLGNVLDNINQSRSEAFLRVHKLTKTYENRYRLKIFNRRTLHVYNPADTEIILSNSKNITKNKPYEFLKPWLGNGLLLATGAQWHNRRKILTPTFHFDILKNFLVTFEERSWDFIKQLKRYEGNPVDVHPVMSDYTLSVICETAFGTRLGSEQISKTAEYKSAIRNIEELTLMRLCRIWLYNDFMFSRSKIGKEFEKCVRIIHSFSDTVIMERKNQTRQKRNLNKSIEDEDSVSRKRRLSLLDLLLEVESRGKIDLEGIRAEVNTFMFEGHDTTASALTFALMLLSGHQEVQERIYEECQQVLADKSTLSISDYAEMKYLEAVIKETLRMYPNPPTVGRFITNDFMLDDILIKKDSEVYIRFFDLHRNEQLYPDPEEFRPARFLDSEMKHPYGYVPFSAGLRNCIGRKFALLELKSTLSKICSTFKIKPTSEMWKRNVILSLMLRPEEPIYLKFLPR